MNDNKGKAIGITLDAKGFASSDSLSMLPTAIITEIAGVIAAVSQDPTQVQLFSSDEAAE